MSSSDKAHLVSLAAAYVRMSTDHQQYSTCNQLEAIQEYARRRGLEIIKVYSDDGKSGLSIQGRDSLAQMIKDMQSGSAGFSCVLVYDVSRWGRFQGADESAYYEYLWRQAGVHKIGNRRGYERKQKPRGDMKQNMQWVRALPFVIFVACSHDK